MNRRRFLGGMVAAGALAHSRRAHAAAALSYGPASFEVTSTSALVWLRASARAQVRVEFGTSATLAGATMMAPGLATPASDYTVVTGLGGLTPDTEYFYRGVVSEEGSDPVQGSIGRFRTAPTAAREFRFAWSGDMEGGRRPFAILDHVTALRPDFFLMLGDTIYADIPKDKFVPSLAHYRAKHREIREDRSLQRMLAAMPVVAMWDDHEVENDFDRTHPALPDGRQAFREYWTIPSSDTLYRRFAWTPALEMFVLDCRSYRNPKADTDGPAKTMLGAVQKAWLKDALKDSQATFKVIVSSVPMLPPTSKVDSWSGYPTERQELVDFIKRERLRNVVVLSADFHVALDYEESGISEFIAGPIGASPYCQGGRGVARRQELERYGRFFICDAMNFGAVTVRPDASPPHIEVQVIDGKGTVRHRRTIPAS